MKPHTAGAAGELEPGAAPARHKSARGKADLKVELEERYCPTCHFETQHAILYQLFFGPRGKVVRREELSTGCAICNSDRYWGLKLATQYDQKKFLYERWIPKAL